MTAEFSAQGPGFETVTVPGILENQRFTAPLTCPLTDDITLWVTFRAGEAAQNQQLGQVTGLVRDSLPHAWAVDTDLWLKPVDETTGTYEEKGQRWVFDWSEGYFHMADGTMVVEIEDIEIHVWVDDALAMVIPVGRLDPEDIHPIRAQVDCRLSGLTLGSRVAISAKITDTLGREEEQWLEGYEVGREDGWKGWRLLHTPDSDERPWERT